MRYMGGGPFCDRYYVFGTVSNADGGPMAAVQLKVWGPNFQTVGQSSDDGLYDIGLPALTEDAKWFVQILESNQNASLALGFITNAHGCDAGTGKQRFRIDWQRIR
jgi:hypothetical protein